jgi:hypothetical protein
MAQKQATEIKSNAIYKILGQNCWMVPSDTSSTMYKVCFDEASSNWTCACRHGEVQAQRGQAAHCKHVAAVQVSIKANLKQEQDEGLRFSPWHGSNRGAELPIDQRGSLGGTREFSLLR